MVKITKSNETGEVIFGADNDAKLVYDSVNDELVFEDAGSSEDLIRIPVDGAGSVGFPNRAPEADSFAGSNGSSGQFLQTDGTNLNFADVPDEVVIQDTEPSSPFEGMWWYDTGSDTMQYYDGTTFVSPASSFDDITITEDSNGDKQVDPTVRGTGWEKLQETQNTSISSGNSLNFSISSTYDEYYVFAKVDGDGFEKLNVTLNNITSGYTLYSNDGTETTGASQFDQIMRLASEGTEEVVSFRIVNSNTSSVLKSNSTTDREASSLNKGLVKSGEISSIELIVEFGSTMNFKIVEVFGREI